MEMQTLSHTRWKCQYHIVFIPKYRQKRLFGKLKRDLLEILRKLCMYKKVEIVNMFRSCPYEYKSSTQIEYI
jgi:putative transposase